MKAQCYLRPTSRILERKARRLWTSPHTFAVILALGLGFSTRLIPVLRSDFPLNDGGLFFVMIQDLIDARYVLPVTTSYNFSHIPFAYPPLPFYLAALIVRFTKQSALDILRLIPPVISMLTIPAFYVLSRAMLRSRAQSIFAVFAFTLFPGSFEWLIMGGGLTRALGFLFALFALHYVHLLYTQHTRQSAKYLLFTLLFTSLTILSHPDASWFVIYSTVILFIFFGRARRELLLLLLIAAGTIVLTAPWWVIVVVRHSVSPFLNASQTGWHSIFSWLRVLLFVTTIRGPFLDILTVLALLGAFVCITRREFFLPFWLVAITMLDPRSGTRYATVPLAMLVERGINDLILPGINGAKAFADLRNGRVAVTQRDDVSAWLRLLLKGKSSKIMLGFFLAHALASAMFIPILPQSSLKSLRLEEREAMEWIASNTEETSQFLVITCADSWPEDATSEWFPAIAQRTSLVTVQGSEWLPDRQFRQRSRLYTKVQRCVNKAEKCLESWAMESGIKFTHVYISKLADRGINRTDCGAALRNSLTDSSRYSLIYENSGAVVFSVASGEETP